jgi:hypothetical protein
MEDPPSDQFDEILKSYMQRYGFSLGRLARGSGIPKSTIANWYQGFVKKPRDCLDLVKVAGAMSLNEVDTNRLLKSACCPAVADLLANAKGEQERDLLSRWEDEIRKRLDKAFVHVPSLPPHYVPRPQTTDIVKARLLADEPATRDASRVTAVHGLGGIGKSTLAAALAHDLQVREHFTDGVLWVTLGQEPDLLPKLIGWLQALGDTGFLPLTAQAASGRLRRLLGDKTALLVIDDAWQLEHVKPFLVGGSRCRILITTREAVIGEELGATLCKPDVMTESQALELFANSLQRDIEESELDQAQALAHELGYLPLALQLAAARVADGVPWTKQVEEIRQEIVRLEALDRPEAGEEADDQIRRERSVIASLNLSLQRISMEHRQRFAWLGVLAEDAEIQAPIASTLWNTDLRTARDVLRYLHRKSLLSLPKSSEMGDTETLVYHIHSFVRRYARHILTSGEPDGLGYSLDEAHAALLAHYRTKGIDGRWSTVPNDGYYSDHLVFHLKQAKKHDQLHALFVDQGWAERRSSTALLSDFVQARETLTEDDDIGIYLRYALFLDVVQSPYTSIPVEAAEPAIKYGLIEPPLIATLIEAMDGEPVEKIRTYLDILAQLPEHLRPSHTEGIVRIAQAIGDPKKRIDFIFVLLQQGLPDRLVRSAKRTIWKATFELTESCERRAWLEKISPLSEEMLDLLRHDALQIDDVFRRVYVFADIWHWLPDVQTQEETWQLILEDAVFPKARQRAFAELAPQLSPYLLEKVAEDIWKMLDSIPDWEAIQYYKPIVEPLLPLIPGERILDAWERARAEREKTDWEFRGYCVASLIPRLPDDYLSDHAADLVKELPVSAKEEARCEILMGLAPYLPLDQQEACYLDAWQAVVENQSGSQQYWLDRAVQNMLPEIAWIAWDRTVAKICSPRDPSYVLPGHATTLRALKGLALGVPLDTVPKACEMICSASNSSFGAERCAEVTRVLIDREPELQDGLWEHVLNLALQDETVPEQTIRFGLAVVLCAQMPEHMQEAYWLTILGKVRALEDVHGQCWSLLHIVAHSPDEQRPAVWLEAWELAHRRAGATVSSILYWLPSCYQQMSPDQLGHLEDTDWDAVSCDSRLIDEGLALLLRHAPEEFRLRVWQSIDGNLSSRACSTVLPALFPSLSTQEQIRVLPEMVEHCVTEEDLAKIGRWSTDWPEEVVCSVWEQVYEKTTVDNDYMYCAWSRALAPYLPDAYVPKAWQMTLERLWPKIWLYYEDICVLLASRLPLTDLEQAWREMDRFQSRGRKSFVSDVKAAMTPRLSRKMLVSLLESGSQKQYNLPQDIFVCTLDKYVRYGGPFCPQENLTLVECLQGGTESPSLKAFAEVLVSAGSYLAYVVVPPLSLLLVLWRAISRAASGRTKKLESKRMLLPIRFRARPGSAMSVVIAVLRMHNEIARHYSLSKPQAKVLLRDSLSRETSKAATLASLRPVIQRIGGRKLCKEVYLAYQHSITWWRDRIAGLG